MFFLQKSENRNHIKTVLREIMGDKEVYVVIKRMLANNGVLPKDTPPITQLCVMGLGADQRSTRMETIIPNPNVPSVTLVDEEEIKITPYWKEIFQQMEKTNWDVEKLKI